MATIQICDHRETTKDGKTQPCSERAEITVAFTDLADGKRYECDLCQIHKKGLVAQSREATSPTPSPYTRTTQLPRVNKPSNAPTIDSVVKEWALNHADEDIKASINKRGRQSRELKAKFLSSPDGIVWQQTNQEG